MAAFVALLLVAALAAALGAWLVLKSRNMHIWIGSWLRRRPRPAVPGPVHVMFCFVDHFEPMWGKADRPNSYGNACSTTRSP